MKKNKMMRLASWLLVLTLLTTCIISGTFAKYVTGDSAGDTARAAKWGVVASVSGSLFGEHYDTEDNGNGIAVTSQGSVDSGTEGQNIVAPGTENMEGIVVNISGVPEVANKVEYTVNTESSKNYSEIWLGAGEYGIMIKETKKVTSSNVTDYYVYDADTHQYKAATESNLEKEDTVYYKLTNRVKTDDIVDEDGPYYNDDDYNRFIEGKYYPIVWTVTTGNSDEIYDGGGQEAHTLSEITDYLPETQENNALADLSHEVESLSLTWSWPFEVGDSQEGDYSFVDRCDTILGNLISYNKENTDDYQVVQFNNGEITGLTVNTDNETGITYAYAGTDTTSPVACLTVGFNIEVTVSQVD